MAKNLKLKMARVEHDMTQGDLADAIGVTRQTIGLIEAGKYNPTLSLCLAICKTWIRRWINCSGNNSFNNRKRK